MAGQIPFASTTGDTRYGLYFGPEEMQMYNDWNTELLEIIVQSSVDYYRIEKDYSNPNSLYGESEGKATRQPIKVFCWISMDSPEVETGRYGTDIKRRLELYMHKDRLVTIGVVPRMGDFIGYDNQFFEIHTVDVPTNLYSYPSTKVNVTVRCMSVRPGVFNPDIDDANQEIEHDSENPF